MKKIQVINKGKCKIYKIIDFFILTFLISFYFEELHDLIFIRVQHYVDVWLFNKTSIIMWRFYLERINYLGLELNLSIRPPRFFKYYLEVLMNINQLEIFSWKTAYSMILANDTKWVYSQLFGCDRAKRGPLGGGTSSPPNVYHWIVTNLIIVFTSLVTWTLISQTESLNQSKCSEVAIYQLECDALIFRTIRNTLYYL